MLNELRSTGQLLSVWTVPQSLEKIDEWIQAERAHAADLPAAQKRALVGNFPLPRSQRVTFRYSQVTSLEEGRRQRLLPDVGDPGRC